MQLINKITRRFFELPVTAKIFSAFLILALVFSSLFVVSLYSPEIIEKGSDAHLQSLTKTELINKLKIEEGSKSVAQFQLQQILQFSEASNSELLLEKQKTKELEVEMSKTKRQLKKQMNLEYFTCGKSQGRMVNKKALINACLGILKVLITENYQSSGQFPNNLSGLGYSSDLHKNKLIEKINFKPQGDIDLFLKPSFGTDRKITLSYGFNHDEQWTCKSNLDDKVLSKKYCGDY